MKIVKMIGREMRISGGVSGKYRWVDCGQTTEVRGKVNGITMHIDSSSSSSQASRTSVNIKVGRKIFEFSCREFPRINVGETVILHFNPRYTMTKELVGLQVVKGEEAIFRFRETANSKWLYK